MGKGDGDKSRDGFARRMEVWNGKCEREGGGKGSRWMTVVRRRRGGSRKMAASASCIN